MPIKLILVGRITQLKLPYTSASFKAISKVITTLPLPIQVITPFEPEKSWIILSIKVTVQTPGLYHQNIKLTWQFTLCLVRFSLAWYIRKEHNIYFLTYEFHTFIYCSFFSIWKFLYQIIATLLVNINFWKHFSYAVSKFLYDHPLGTMTNS